MKKTIGLSSADRAFLSKAIDLILLNPFSKQWLDTTHKILPQAQLPLHSRKVFFSTLTARLDAILLHLRKKNLVAVADFEQNDHDLMRYVFLLRSFINCSALFEKLMRKQQSSQRPVVIRFSDQVTHELQQQGFTEPESYKYFSLFYQIQRAYYFTTHLIVGDSDSMKQLRRAIWNCIFTLNVRTYDQYLWNRMEDFSTLLLGDTGTGKGVVAAAIGRSGYIPFNPEKCCFERSPNETFTAVNLSQFPESLIESELFGHCKGAFTSAVDNHKGLLESCPPFGSLFLDEIGDVSVAVQIKLLQVLQERTFMPVGSHQCLYFKGRVIAATNRTLALLRQNAQFRDDFYYRLCSEVITVPSLQQRLQESPAELEQLVRLLIKRMAGYTSGDLAQQVIDTLKRDLPADYHWPGNVRELEQAVRRILLSGSYSGHLVETRGEESDTFSRDLQDGGMDIRELSGRYCRLLYQRFPSYAAVSRITGLDRRTVKKYLAGSADM